MYYFRVLLKQGYNASVTLNVVICLKIRFVGGTRCSLAFSDLQWKDRVLGLASSSENNACRWAISNELCSTYLTSRQTMTLPNNVLPVCFTWPHFVISLLLTFQKVWTAFWRVGQNDTYRTLRLCSPWRAWPEMYLSWFPEMRLSHKTNKQANC